MIKLSDIPNLPGVYFFRNKNNEIIYIGKALSLKKRVASYFRKNIFDWKINSICQELYDISYQVTKNEIAALILEAELIQKYKPRFNVLLKYGSPFVYILFLYQPTPLITIGYKPLEGGSAVGPFLHKRVARYLVYYLQKTFQLYRCNKKIPLGCLHYHLGLCSGSCLATFNEQEYKERLTLAYHALTENQDQFIKEINNQIALYNKDRAFEKAQKWAQYAQHALDILKTVGYPDKGKDEEVLLKSSQDPNQSLPFSLQNLLQSHDPIVTVDCFDISHFQGRCIVGSAIRFCNGIAQPGEFRHFKISSITLQNDYAALQEIVMRRYRSDPFPDLILIDGGKGQLSAVESIVSLAFVVSIAKKEERIFSSTFSDGIILDKHNPAALFLMKVRDYAHHFAISYHKKLQKKSL